MAFNPNATYRTIVDIDGNVFAYQGGVYYDKYNNSYTALPQSKNGYVAPGDPNVYSSSTFASLPTAASVSGLTYRVTDIGGVNGSLWRSNGTIWYPANGSAVLLKCAIPIISCSSGSMGNNGTLSAITALPTTYSSGAWVNLPAGAIAAGVPAAQTSYWVVFSSTTAGTVFNNIQPSTGFPTPPTTLVPFVTTGPGAFTGITAATTLLTVPIQGGNMGTNGQLRVSATWLTQNSAGTKTLSVSWGGSQLIAPVRTTQAREDWLFRISNVNSQSLQSISGNAIPTIGSIVAQSYTTINTANSANIVFAVTNNTATDFSLLTDVLVELIADGT